MFYEGYHHVLFKIISNDSSQIRPVGRNTVWLISRHSEGVRSWELHHKNRRVVVSPNIWVRRPNSSILNGSWRGRVRSAGIECVFWAFSDRNLGVGGWDFVRIEFLICSIDPYGCWEVNPSKLLLIFEPNKCKIYRNSQDFADQRSRDSSRVLGANSQWHTD